MPIAGAPKRFGPRWGLRFATLPGHHLPEYRWVAVVALRLPVLPLVPSAADLEALCAYPVCCGRVFKRRAAIFRTPQLGLIRSLHHVFGPV